MDAYVPGVNAVHESKVGYTSLSSFVRKQVDKDAAFRCWISSISNVIIE
ncbi:hypothetical protein [Bacillus sp. 179-C3.3 HS]